MPCDISSVFHGAPAEQREAVEADTYALLERLGIPYDRVDTPPAFTMEDCAAISKALNVSVCKNLFLTPRNKSAFYLLALPADKPFVTKDFSKQIGSSRLSFASAEDMEELLGIKPGSASVLALRNDTAHCVTLAMERSVYEATYFGCHPCRNTSTVRLRTEDLLRIFLPFTGHEPVIVDL
ncbi:MAG: prolyl-tRNA synthetase associated domain-containing protein [Clostridiales bacterium]|nr:prolyl-tRNA synthetase associated domain-containing protein [Clostridiales bacterium]